MCRRMQRKWDIRPMEYTRGRLYRYVFLVIISWVYMRWLIKISYAWVRLQRKRNKCLRWMKSRMANKIQIVDLHQLIEFLWVGIEMDRESHSFIYVSLWKNIKHSSSLTSISPVTTTITTTTKETHLYAIVITLVKNTQTKIQTSIYNLSNMIKYWLWETRSSSIKERYEWINET